MSAPAIPRLRPVAIQELKLLDGPREWQVDQLIHNLESIRPVRGKLRAKYGVHLLDQGPVLEVQGEIATVISLCCDRCLRQFDHPLRARASELLSLGESPQEGSASEHLDPRGNFDPEQWVFEQLSLQLPHVTNCGVDCPGPSTWQSQNQGVDPRWAALARLKE